MRKARIILFFGIWIAILPYLGFPYSWKGILLTISGLALIYVSYDFYREAKEDQSKETTFDNFRENTHFEDNNDNEEVEITIEGVGEPTNPSEEL